MVHLNYRGFNHVILFYVSVQISPGFGLRIIAKPVDSLLETFLDDHGFVDA